MNVKQLKTLFFFSTLFLFSHSFAQTTSIDYTTSSLYTGICNVFNTATVQKVGGQKHYPVAGGVSFDGSKLDLETQYNSSAASNYGTAYAIQYPFTAGWSYVIKFTAYGTDGNNGSTAPNISGYLFPDLSFRSGSAPAACGGVRQSSWSAVLSGTLTGSFTTTQSSATYTCPSITPTSNNNYLVILASGGSSGLNHLYITNVTIIATAPIIAFQLAPASVDKVCGTALSQTFAVTNVYSTTGVSGYVWNLGSAANGWTYNGAPAPQTISTPGPSITLTAATCVAAIQNISAAATINNTNYNTNTAAVTLSSSLSISGASSFCNSPSSYIINNLPCGATVAWSVTPSGIVTPPNPATGPQTTLTKISGGTVTLTATISNVCGNTVTSSRPITVEADVPDFGIQATVPCQPGSIVQSSTFTAVPSASGVTYHWRSVSNGISTTIPGSGPSVSKKFPLGSHQVFAYGTNACGGSDEVVYNFNVLNCPSGMQSSDTMLLSPNPATTTLNVEVKNPGQKKTGNISYIEAVELIDKSGNIKLRKQFGQGGASKISLSVNQFPSDIYTLRVFSNGKWTMHKVIVLH